MKRRSGFIWVASGIALAVVAGLLALWVILRASSTVALPAPHEPEVEVVVASRFIGVRELLQRDDVETKTAPADIVPENAARSVNQVVGTLAMAPLSPDQMILTSQVVSPTVKGQHIAFLMDETQVAMAYPPSDLMSQINLLKAGDHVDLLFSIDIQVEEEGGGGLVTFNALQDLEIASIVYAGGVVRQAGFETVAEAARPVAIVFTLDPQDALVLKQLKDRGGIVDIVLRAPEATERFDTQPVNEDYLIDRYLLRIPVLP
jgi:pilus assembly protein CpaB